MSSSERPEGKYRVAVVGGAGTWGRHYVRAYAEHPDCEIVALIDRAKDRRQAFADRYGIDTVCDDVEDLLSETIPDIVSAIVPVHQSLPVLRACVEKGVKVVSCEKPLAVSLAEADELVQVCRDHGSAFGCGTAHYEVPHLLHTARWVQAGHIGKLNAAAIPAGLPNEVSGAGCVQLTMLRALTGMEVEWVEGWTLPPAVGWLPEAFATDPDIDRPAYGRLGLSGGIVCEISQPRQVACRVSVTGETGQVWLGQPQSVHIEGTGAEAAPVYPEFLKDDEGEIFTNVVERLMRAFDTGEEAQCNGHDYRQALEIAIALKLSAERNHERIHLPLEDRSLRILPHPYRQHGGDVAGWQSIGYSGPPQAT